MPIWGSPLSRAIDRAAAKAAGQAVAGAARGGIAPALAGFFAPSARTRQYAIRGMAGARRYGRLREELGKVEQGLEETIGRYQQRLRNLRRFSDDDINRYTEQFIQERLSQTPEFQRAVRLRQSMNRARAEAVWGPINAAYSYFTEGGLFRNLGRMGAAAFGIGTVSRLAGDRGGPFTDRYGNFDIAGIPFI